ncbi:CHAP domain-containing protein, partial [Streptosporangium algeriense]
MHKFIELLESQLGYAERSSGYTKFGQWYNTVEFDADYSTAPWCDMYLSWAAKKLGYEDWVGQFAYTVYHAKWFRQQDAWGTVPKPGAIVFFDWSGGRKIDGIDHVGIVTRVEGGRIHTIEGNIDGGVAKRKVRDTDKVVGYGYPEKIKARLDEEAAQQQEIITASRPDNSVALTRTPDLLSQAPPVTVRENLPPSPPVRTGPKHAKPETGAHAKAP